MSLEKLAYTIAEAVEVTGLSDDTLYRKHHAGEITMKKSGRRTVIDADDLKRLIDNLPRSQDARLKLKLRLQIFSDAFPLSQQGGMCRSLSPPLSSNKINHLHRDRDATVAQYDGAFVEIRDDTETAITRLND